MAYNNYAVFIIKTTQQGKRHIMKINIIDVAKKAGVSPATVSNVRTGKRNVNPELVKKVNDAILELNYIPNSNASSLRGNSTNIIGVMLPSFHHPFHAQMLKGIQDVASNTKYSICAFPTYNNQKIELKCLQQLGSIMPDAILTSSYAMNNNENGTRCFQMLKEFCSNGTPVISLERNLDHIPGVHSVYYDSIKPSYDMTGYLIGLGHKKIAFIGGPEDFDVSEQRLTGYMNAMNDHHLEIQSSWVHSGEFNGANGYHTMQNLLSLTDPITAVFCANDEIALGAVKAIKELNLRIPADIAVVGFDDIYPSTLIDPPLTTINVPADVIGKLAMEHTLSLLSETNETDFKSIPIKTTLVKRKSTELNLVSSWNIDI